MKNASAAILLFITVAFAAFIGGVFFGRVTAKPPSFHSVQYSATESTGGPMTDSKLNINTATIEELILLPGIGETLAQRIVEYRENVATFTSIDQLLDVSGIGAVKLNAIKEYITVGG